MGEREGEGGREGGSKGEGEGVSGRVSEGGREEERESAPVEPTQRVPPRAISSCKFSTKETASNSAASRIRYLSSRPGTFPAPPSARHSSITDRQTIMQGRCLSACLCMDDTEKVTQKMPKAQTLTQKQGEREPV